MGKSVDKLFKTVTKPVANITDGIGLTNFSGDEAKKYQSDATDKANRAQGQMYDQQRADFRPYTEAGSKALSSLANNDFMKDWQQDPGYQFRMDQGMKAINNAAAARGMANGGATLKALTQYGQDFGANEYNNIYNRNFARLSSLANMGQNSAAGTASAAQNYGAQMSNNYLGLGNAQAANEVAAANRAGQFVNGAMQAFGGGGGGDKKSTAGAAMFSDERLKEDITPISEADIQEFKNCIKPVTFKYKDQAHGADLFPGVIAQDLEKSKLGKMIVSEDEQGLKQIDLLKAISLLIAIQGKGE